MLKNLPLPTYCLHILHGHGVGFHAFIFILNNYNDLTSFNSFGIMDQILGPRNERVSVPQVTVLTLHVLNGNLGE